nr:serine protease inhibitor (SERPIN) family protein [Tanacetum cinerariifolium]
MKPIEAVIEVNSWAEKQTNGLIKGVLPAGCSLVLPFTCGGLTEMADEGLRVSSIHHKAFLEVNEEGTEAAAATGLVADGLLVDFVADHPFLIREDVSGEVLFTGQVVNPSVH